MSQKCPKCQGLVKCKSGPGNNMVGKRKPNSIVSFFNNRSSQPRQLLRNKIFLKKLARGNAHWTNY